jgi:NAD(P)-dependent dehydrogenase (short-subunit alcohol dehydrogenase family)
MRLGGKVIVITGAALGMGQAMVRLFAQEGARLIAGDWNAEALKKTVGEAQRGGGEITALHGDISVRKDAEALVELAVERYGRIDGLVNNAGVLDRFQAVDTVEDEVWNRVLGINLYGPMCTSRVAVRHMLSTSKGSIVNVSSFAGSSGAASGVAYGVSKHGLVGLTRNTAWMYMHSGIRCNAILPGGVETSIGSNLEMDKLDAFALRRTNPTMALMPPMMPAKEIAQMALFLLSDESAQVNGALIPVDGGLRAF